MVETGPRTDPQTGRHRHHRQSRLAQRQGHSPSYPRCRRQALLPAQVLARSQSDRKVLRQAQALAAKGRQAHCRCRLQRHRRHPAPHIPCRMLKLLRSGRICPTSNHHALVGCSGRSEMPSPRIGAGQGAVMDWARMLAYVTGTVDQELLARNEYLAAENRILKAQLNGRLRLSDAERKMLGEIGHRLGRRVLADVATVARPDTILGWYRRLIARKFDGSKARRVPGRPRIKPEVERLIIRMA